MKHTYLLIVLSASLLFFTACKKENNNEPEKTTNILFSVNDDKNFGKQFDDVMMSDSSEYVILDSASNPQAYAYIYGLTNKLLQSGKVAYADEFEWKVRIIEDTILNAFAVPGGYLYFYTGLIHYLDKESELTGIIAHEMAHVARRHSTSQLTKQYGTQILLSILLGNNTNQFVQIAADMAGGLSGLAFSRADEYEADNFAVKYMYPTGIDAVGVAGFFEKMEAEGLTAGAPPAILSTHPSPENRIEEIYKEFEALGGVHGTTNETPYAAFKALLN